MKKFGVVNSEQESCTICGAEATTEHRGESRCKEHAGSDDTRTGLSKAAEDQDVDARSR